MMTSTQGSSYDWILGEDADEDLEPWQRVLKENAKNAKVERFRAPAGILGPDELLNLAGLVRDMDVQHMQKLYMKQWQEHQMAASGGIPPMMDPAAMMMGHPPPMMPPGFVPGYLPHYAGLHRRGWSPTPTPAASPVRLHDNRTIR